jgi:hypothetical protein
MESRKVSGFTLLPTAALFGLGIGNLWGIAGVFSRIGNAEWVWMVQAACLIVLVAFLCGVARAWWTRGAAIPLLLILVAAWIFSAPIAAVTGKFTLAAWATWLLVLAGCGAVALLLAWLLERGTRTDA